MKDTLLSGFRRAACIAQVASLTAAALCFFPREALAIGRYAEPPPGAPPADAQVPRERPVYADPPSDESPREPVPPYYEASSVRILVLPAMTWASGQSNLGILTGLDIGTGPLGCRLSAMWTRGLTPTDPNSKVTSFMDAYSIEFPYSIRPKRAFQPIVALGLALVNGRIAGATEAALMGAGTARLTLEYRFPMGHNIDLRAQMSGLGGLLAAGQVPGGAHGYAAATAGVTIGL
jgi:hypothetical protein